MLVAVAERWRHAVGCAGGIRGCRWYVRALRLLMAAGGIRGCRWYVRALRLRMAAGWAVSECRAPVIHGGGGVRQRIDCRGRASQLEKLPQASRTMPRAWRRCRELRVRRGSVAPAGRTAGREGAGAAGVAGAVAEGSWARGRGGCCGRGG